jgi:exodeoxyribonuclease V beta subunit
VRRLALGAFVGRTADQLAVEDSEQLGLRLRVWARVLEDRGVSALFEAVCLSEAVQPRVLSHTGGERLLTDLRHLTEALHEAALEGQLGLTALLGWLRRRRDGSRQGGRASSAAAGLESDARRASRSSPCTPARASSSPSCWCPFAWDRGSPDAPSTRVFHDAHGPACARRRRLRAAPTGVPTSRRTSRTRSTTKLRLTYVALTRAQGQLVLWWAGSKNTPTAPLHRLLLHDDPARRTAGERSGPRRTTTRSRPSSARGRQRRRGCRWRWCRRVDRRARTPCRPPRPPC